MQTATRPLTNRILDRERNILLAGFLVLFALNLAFGKAFRFGLPDPGLLGGYAVFIDVAATVIYVYLVYRLSRMLGQPWWQRFLYSVFAIFAGFELVPLVGLLIAVRLARGTVEERPQ